MWNELWKRHKGLLIGITAGLFLGIVYLISGFWDMLVVAFIIAVCAYIGGKLDAGGFQADPDEWMRKVTDRWKWFR